MVRGGVCVCGGGGLEKKVAVRCHATDVALSTVLNGAIFLAGSDFLCQLVVYFVN